MTSSPDRPTTPPQATTPQATSRQITSQETTRFRQDGVVLLRGLVGDEWLEPLAGAIDRDMADPGPGYHGYLPESGGRFHGNFDLWRNDRDFARYCLSSPLPAAAAQLLGAETVHLFYDQLFVKEAGTPSPTPWHNDQPYWPVAGRQTVSFWLSLDPVTQDSGALEFVRGSHAWDRWFQPRTFSEGGYQYEQNPAYEPLPDFDELRDTLDVVSWEMEPGDVLAFHGLTVHGAGGNLRSDRRRRGYTVRYTGEDVTYDPRPGTNPALRHPEHPPGRPLDAAIYPLAFPEVVSE